MRRKKRDRATRGHGDRKIKKKDKEIREIER